MFASSQGRHWLNSLEVQHIEQRAGFYAKSSNSAADFMLPREGILATYAKTLELDSKC